MTPLSYFEKAVEAAVKGGYLWQGLTVFCIQRGDQFLCTQEGNHSQLVTVHQMLLDPKWWEALGDARGWGESCHHLAEDGYAVYRHRAVCNQGMHPWQMHRHRFLDHLDEGGDIESFFKGLANEKV